MRVISRHIFRGNIAINPICVSIGKQSLAVMTSDDAIATSFFLDRIFYPEVSKIKKSWIYIEGRWVYPDEYSLQYLYDLYQHFSVLYPKHARASFSNYVSFTRAKFSQWDKISCDWCSLVNGVAEYITETLRAALECGSNDILLLQPLSNWILSVKYLRYLPYSVVRCLYDSDMVNQDKSNLLELLNANFPHLDRDQHKAMCRIVHQIVEFKMVVSLLERRWCPFMHLKKMAYRRDYHCFNSRARDHIELVGELLKEMGCVDVYKCDIDVYQCNVNINASLSDPDQTPSLFQGYLDLFIQ